MKLEEGTSEHRIEAHFHESIDGDDFLAKGFRHQCNLDEPVPAPTCFAIQSDTPAAVDERRIAYGERPIFAEKRLEPMRARTVMAASNGERFEVTLKEWAGIDDSFRVEWRDLDNEPEISNPYFSSWFLEPALKGLDQQRGVRLCVVRRADDGLMVGLLPVTLGATYAKVPLRHFAVWRHIHGYNGAPLFRRGFGHAGYAALIQWIDTYPDGARGLRLVDHPLPARNTMEAACANRGRCFFVLSRRDRAILTGGQGFPAMMARAYSGKKQKEFRRQARRFGELGEARFRRLECEEEIASAASAFIDLERSGWKGRAPHAIPITKSMGERRFFTEAMAAGSRAGAVICDALMLDGKPVAMLFSLRSGDGLSAFKIAFDETYATYSPGTRLMIEATRAMLDDSSLKLFDSCARSDHPLADRLWRERMTIGQINIPAGGTFDAVLLRFCTNIDRAKKVILAET